ncbi:phosphoribosyl-ATP pyrophosphohydrolase [Clostridium taeniosporum]|uniref:Phosphoribosyl-ATP pyrophosphohydrolase n=1 Tax=Clostridium taeniosporum TaxID=394958 RepID=A0A1D7XNP1_9CLOT|nr:phosphoribosyl-ATP pyrophosphohydrolase [Clostridium taeniosporum]
MDVEVENCKSNLDKLNYKEYNKLVRDKIPYIIKEDGKECDFEIVTKDEKHTLLEKKLQEEVDEFIEDKNLEELADIMEVIIGLAKSLGYSEEELLKVRDKKNAERGGFEKGILLRRVIFNDNV